MSFLTPVWSYVDALVHPAARIDALTAARHRAFIAPRLIGSFAALVSLPVYLAVRGAPSALEIGIFGWLIAPIFIACFLSRTGAYESAHALSALSLTGVVALLAWCTGGIASFAAIGLVLGPLEAALSGSRRVVALASLLALAAAGLLALMGHAGNVPPPTLDRDSIGVLGALGVVALALYASGVAFGAEAIARSRSWAQASEEDWYRLLARNMTDVITRHGASGDVLFVSPAAEPLFGARASELMGHGLFERVHVADRPAYLKALADAAALGETRSVEFRIRRADAEIPQFVWIEMRCQPLERPGPARQSREVVAVLRDISERKTQERTVELARAEQERAHEAKSRFLATMSHELRTPLNAIIGFSDMLADETLVIDPARKVEYARLINESGRHLLSLVNGILDVSKIEMGNFEVTPEPFAPGPVVTSCCDLLALKAREAGVEIKTRIASDLPELTADRRAFNQILINLISNAIKFTPRDGRVTVAARAETGVLALTVEDTGVGIAEDDLARVGEAFFQARASYDRRHDGAGLGLSIVKGLVRLHNGAVDIESRLGKGTRVTVKLPLGRSPRAADPVKLVSHRTQDIASAAHAEVETKVKKIA